MSILPIYIYGSPVLKKKAKPVTEVSDAIVKLIMDMFETMHNANGIGLAATQAGNMNRVIVIDVSDLEETKGIPPFVMINPVIVSEEGSWPMEEGCLSIPDIRDEVERAETIRVKFKDAQFKNVEIEVCGLLGRVILHEIDHLNGVLFIDHLSPKQKKVHAASLKKIQRGEIEVNYPVVTAANVPV